MPTPQKGREASSVGSIRVLTVPALPKMEEWLKSNRKSDQSLVQFGAWYDQKHEEWRRTMEGMLGNNFNTIRLLQDKGLSEEEVSALFDAKMAAGEGAGGGDSTGGSTGVTLEQVYQIVNAANATYVHWQNDAAKIWHVLHDLGRYPAVSVVDSGDTEVWGEVTYVNSNYLTITFDNDFGGKAYLG